MAYARCDEPDAVGALLRPAPGLRLVEVRAERTELRAGHAAVRAAVHDAVRRAVGSA